MPEQIISTAENSPQGELKQTFEGFEPPKPLDEILHPDSEYQEHFDWMKRLTPAEFQTDEERVW